MVALFDLVVLCLPSLVLSASLRQKNAGHQLGSRNGLGTVDVEKRSLQEVYEAAIKEIGTLRIAWGGDVQQSKEDIAAAFAEKYPRIKFKIVIELSKYLDSNINRTYKETNGTDNGVDLTVIQTITDFPRWKSEGRLLPYKVIPWNDIYPQFVDKDGAYTGAFIFSFGRPVYNPKTTSNTTLPKSYSDYLLPKWGNKIILTYPNDDDAVLYLFKRITDKYGFNYIHSLLAQNATWVRGTATPAILIANNNPHINSDANTGLRNSQSISFAAANAFNPDVAVQAFGDVRMVWPQTGAIFATTKMPESAKLFLNFLMDDDWQGMVGEGEFATRRKFDKAGVFNQSDLDPLGYGKFMADRQQVESLRFQFEELLGTPVGKNPVNVW